MATNPIRASIEAARDRGETLSLSEQACLERVQFKPQFVAPSAAEIERGAEALLADIRAEKRALRPAPLTTKQRVRRAFRRAGDRHEARVSAREAE